MKSLKNVPFHFFAKDPDKEGEINKYEINFHIP